MLSFDNQAEVVICTSAKRYCVNDWSKICFTLELRSETITSILNAKQKNTFVAGQCNILKSFLNNKMQFIGELVE